MAQLTKAQLIAQLEAAHVSYQLLEAKFEALLPKLEAAKAQLPAPTREAAPLSPYRAALAAAKAQAMRSGKCVSVSAR